MVVLPSIPAPPIRIFIMVKAYSPFGTLYSINTKQVKNNKKKFYYKII